MNSLVAMKSDLKLIDKITLSIQRSNVCAHSVYLHFAHVWQRTRMAACEEQRRHGDLLLLCLVIVNSTTIQRLATWLQRHMRRRQLVYRMVMRNSSASNTQIPKVHSVCSTLNDKFQANRLVCTRAKAIESKCVTTNVFERRKIFKSSR